MPTSSRAAGPKRCASTRTSAPRTRCRGIEGRAHASSRNSDGAPAASSCSSQVKPNAPSANVAVTRSRPSSARASSASARSPSDLASSASIVVASCASRRSARPAAEEPQPRRRWDRSRAGLENFARQFGHAWGRRFRNVATRGARLATARSSRAASRASTAASLATAAVFFWSGDKNGAGFTSSCWSVGSADSPGYVSAADATSSAWRSRR
mmetsp:Transcript_27093/g.87738  ORF Transcript_27093/g.87738 Transcript_27093/m.87738 type:complete len:212 (+) Transcript_27093:696-1331(+)